MNGVLQCPPYGDLAVEWDGRELHDSEELELNVRLLEGIWPQAWPAIKAALLDVVREYEFEDLFEPASKWLVISVPDLRAHPEARWWITVHTDPFAGIWDVKVQGAEVAYAGIAF